MDQNGQIKEVLASVLLLSEVVSFSSNVYKGEKDQIYDCLNPGNSYSVVVIKSYHLWIF